VSPRHWLLVTRPWNWQICESKAIFGMDDRYKTTLGRFVKPGDLAAVYVTGLGIVGVIEVTDVFLDQTDSVGWKRGVKEATAVPELYPHRLKWKWSKKFDVPRKIDPRTNALLDELEYFTDKSQSWYSFVYPTIARVPAEDIQSILRW